MKSLFKIAAIMTILTIINSTSVFAQQLDAKKIVIFGDSITAGYGIDPNMAFPALIQDKIDQSKLNYSVINAGLSGETTAGGLRRIDWILKNKIDIFILELGANDALRGLDLNASEQNLIKIINKVTSQYPEALIFIAEMKIPHNFGPKYTLQFQNIFTNVAKVTDSILIPFILDGVGGVQTLNQADGIHPTEEGQKVIAENVWKVLKDNL